ncbi:alpha-2-macroglobulin family protein [Silvimonas iriomotensis]|uniref:Alpha-2-macroglobulin n=1 Tax=Silvimonas iriomotensis TaxID=449662 RepID=A0ABQ2PEA3_9NEIS|nr:MG2 domain-containing protein [Silvimonas iriomotensis]GGP23574.1 alpha-2-macroglobulin [Silvimonas iriomotensis]
MRLPAARGFVSVVFAFAWIAASAATVTTFSPQNEVRTVQQVRATFSAPMVRMGDTRAAAPFTVDCPQKGDAHWIDDRSWVMDFPGGVPGATTCRFTVRPEVRAVSGEAVTGQQKFSFTTGPLAVTDSLPGQGSQIEEDQAFLFLLNGPIGAKVLPMFCLVEGSPERLPMQRLADADKTTLLKYQGWEKQSGTIEAVRCAQRLPAGKKVKVVLDRPGSAEKQTLDFTVRDAFTATLNCQRENANAACIPLRPVTLHFSAEVTRQQASQIVLQTPNGERHPDFGRERDNLVYEATFNPPFPPNASFKLKLPDGFTDASGRELTNKGAFPLSFGTASAPPLAKFAAAPFGIVELNAEPAIAVTLRDVEADLDVKQIQVGMQSLTVSDDQSIMTWLAKVEAWHESSVVRGGKAVETRRLSLLVGQAGVQSMKVPTAPDKTGKWPFTVVGVPAPEPGLHVVELQSRLLGKSLLGLDAPMYVRTAMLVTNLGVHLKRGRDNAAVWVTTLDRAAPVPDAQVSVYDCHQQLLWQGKTNSQGIAKIERSLQEADHCPSESLSGLFVVARKQDEKGRNDVSFVRSGWDQGIEAWRFPYPTDTSPQPSVRATTVLDRPLFRAGETVSMKHFMRLETSKGLALPRASQLPDELVITHEGSGQSFTYPLAWRQGRYAESTFAIPKSAKLGMYTISLIKKAQRRADQRSPASIEQDGITLYTGSFRVEEFRLPVMRGQLAADTKATIAPGNVPLAVSLSYGTGGPAKGLPVQVSAMLRNRYDRAEGYERFSFDPPEAAEETGRNALNNKVVLDKAALTLDANGNGKTQVSGLPRIDRPYDMVVEATYSDPNGEVQTLSRTVPLWPASVRVGLSVEDWMTAGKTTTVKGVVVDTNGKPLANRKVTVKAVEHTWLSSRKRLVGGFYAYDSHETTKDLGQVCDARTDARGLMFCDVTLKNEGSIELIAQTADDAGHAIAAAQRIWVSREGEMWFDVDNNDRIDVLPEKTAYQPGDTAHLQVRMPFRKATALLAIEREGVIDTRVVELSGKDPVIDVKIEPEWAPNVYVSVLAVRGRVRDVPWYSFFTWGWRSPLEWWDAFRHEGHDYQAPTAMIDLSRPAFKYGIAELTVGTAGHKLAVTVTPDKPVYAIRKTATVKVQVKLPNGQPAAGAEVAFAAVDEALLELQPNDSWDLLGAMLQRRSYGVETATAQLQVVGKRHFGRKALAPGGGGGFAPTRELLDTLLLWQPHVVLDKTGSATVSVPINDALTRFKLVAVADAGDAYFGTGQATITVTQDLQMTAGVAPLARSGDQLDAGINVRNGSSRAMTVVVEAQATGLPGLSAQTVQIPAGEAREVRWPVTVPPGVDHLQWTFAAHEQGGDKAQDKLAFSQQIEPATPVTVQQATLRQLTAPVSIPVALPPGAEAGRGGVSVQLQARLAGEMPAVRDWFLRYPYSCLEQRSSIAVGLNDKQRWAGIMADLPTYLDSDGLAQYFPVQEGSPPRGSDTLTAYVLALANENGWTIPDDSRERMLTALTNFVEGRLKRDFWMPRDSGDARRLAALEALSRYGRAQPRQLDTLTLQPNSWSTTMLIDWLSVLQHMTNAPDRATRMAQAEQVLRGRLTYQGTRMVFSTEREDYWWWLMNNADVNSARLVLVASQLPSFKDDMPRLLTGLLGRQDHGAWMTTNANAWGALAVRHFSAQFESQPVTGLVNLSLGTAKQAVPWSAPQPPRVDLPWPAGGQGTLALAQQGGGAPWATVQVLAALPLTTPQVAGYHVKKTVTPVETKTPGQYSRGDVLRVKLEITAQADMTWVVVDDPVPTGASILGNGLGRDSQIATQGEQQEGNAWPAFIERRFAGYRAYYEYVPRGTFSVEYTMRLNSTGAFKLPPTRVEALYAPDVFGAAPNPVYKVGDAH